MNKPKKIKGNNIHNMLANLLHEHGFILPHGYIIKRCKICKVHSVEDLRIKEHEGNASKNEMHRIVVAFLRKHGYQLPHGYEVRKCKICKYHEKKKTPKETHKKTSKTAKKSKGAKKGLHVGTIRRITSITGKSITGKILSRKVYPRKGYVIYRVKSSKTGKIWKLRKALKKK